MEIFLVGGILIFIMIYSGRINTGKFVADNSDLFNILKENDYDFLLLAKYGDKVYDIQSVFMRRVRDAAIVFAFFMLVIITKMSFLMIVVALIVSFLVFKMQYFSLKSYYRNHLNQIDSLLPYYLKGLEVLIQHYTVPVALAKSIEDAPEVFKPGLREMVAKIEAGDASIQPYIDFANMYPVRDSMRMMRLLYRLGLGEQERKHQQLLSFSKSVSNLQEKSRQQKYKLRLDKMEKKTMTMLLVVGSGGLVLMLISMVMMLVTAI